MGTDFKPLPEPGDILWCKFPHSEDSGNPGPYPRPGLVVYGKPPARLGVPESFQL